MTDVSEWNTADASNNGAPPGGAPEGMLPSAVNDVIRAIMGAIARLDADTNGSLTSTGSSNAYLLAANQTISAYAQGQPFIFEANHTNDGAATLNVDSVGVDAIVLPDGSALVGGEITLGGIYIVIHDGTNFQLLNAGNGDLTANSLELSDTTAVDLTDSDNVLNVGPGTGQHVAMDGNDIQSKSDATTAAAINVNQLGGETNIGAQSGTGGATFFKDGSQVATLREDGISLRGDGTDVLLNIENTSGTQIGFLRMFEVDGDFQLEGVQNGGTFRVIMDDTGGTPRNIITGTGDGVASLFYGGTAKLSTDPAGADVFGSRFELDNSASAGATRIAGRNSEGGFVLLADGDTMEIRQADNLGTDEDTWIQMANNGGVTLNYDDSSRLSTTLTGAGVNGTLLDLIAGADSDSRFRVYNSSGGITLEVESSTGIGRIERTNSSGGVTGIYATFSPTGATTLYNNGAAEFNTQDSDASGNTTGAQVQHHDGTDYDVGLNVMPINGSGSAIELDDSNVGHLIRKTGANDVDITTTTNNAPNGSTWIIINESGSALTIDATSVTLTQMDGASGATGDRTLADNGVCTVVKRATGQYIIWGVGLS